MLGRNHPLCRSIRLWRRDAAARAADGAAVAEGPRLAAEALAAGARIRCAIYADDLRERDGGVSLLERLAVAEGVELHRATRALLDSLQDARSPQPLLLVVERVEAPFERCVDAHSGPPLVVVAHAISDPGNLGTILRTSAAAGANGLLVTGEGADPFHPRAMRASAGAIFRLPVRREAAGGLAERLRARGLRLFGADPRGEIPHSALDWRAPLALFLGGEAHGLPAALDGALDARVRIEMHAPVESLSVGAAAAVLLFEAARARAPQA